MASKDATITFEERRRTVWDGDRHFQVSAYTIIRLTDTVTWHIGEELTERQVKDILSSLPMVKVTIVPAK